MNSPSRPDEHSLGKGIQLAYEPAATTTTVDHAKEEPETEIQGAKTNTSAELSDLMAQLKAI